MDLERLFGPGSIAVVGASATEGKLGYEAMRNVADFDGPVYPVNPNGEGEVFGEPFVRSIGDAGEAVDLALLCVPAPIVPDVVAECGEAGVGAAIVYAGGFAEAGQDGRTRQEALVEAAETHDVALLGPNTSGYFMPHRGLYTSFVSNPEVVEPGNVAVVAQSGGIAHSLAFQGVNEGWGFSGVVGLGNRAVVGFEPVVEYFDADPNTDAIVLHVEGTENARGLMETCAAVGTPVLAYPVGERDVESFAASHTGALTGSYELYRAGFEQYGVPVFRGTAELLDAGHVLANASLPRGPNVGVVTAQAGPGIVVADQLQAHGVRLPPLAEETREAISEHLPGTTYAENPVDTGRPTPGFDDLVGTVARDPDVDAVLVYMVYEEAVGFPPEGITAIPEEVDKPVVFATDGPDEFAADDLAELEAGGVPSFQTPERGANAMGALVRYGALNAEEAGGKWDGEGEREGEGTGGRGGDGERDGDRDGDREGEEEGTGGRGGDENGEGDREDETASSDAIQSARSTGRSSLTEAEAKRLLASAGVTVPEFREVDSADGAVAAAGEIGYPVVVKVASAAVQHKSEWGGGAGVAVGLDSAESVRVTAERILARAEEEGIDASVLVEGAADLDAGTEVIVGGVREPSFGPTVLVGLGGVFTEVIEDASHRLAPVDRREARSMVEELAGAELLSGYRGRPAADLDALVDVVVAVGDLLYRHDGVAEIDLNPVLATADGAVALDALVVLGE